LNLVAEPVLNHSKRSYGRLSLRWGGSAGDGLQSTGILFQKYLNRLGFFSEGFPGTQSTIRGGHVWQHVELSTEQIYNFDRKLNVLVALNPDTLDIHFRDVKSPGFLFYNSDTITIENFQQKEIRNDIQLFAIPLRTLSRKIDLKASVLANTISIGCIIAFLGLDADTFKATLDKRFLKQDRILSMNIAALEAGIQYFNENYSTKLILDPPHSIDNKRIIVNGNEAIALGAAASGLKFLAQYPITPASTILKYLSNKASQFGIVVRQAEDELAAITMCIGASFAGVRSMTASSGPGLSLMAEAFGYASMTETPLVIVNSMRAGPSTGIPTKMEQADLNSMLYLSHGESPRAIFAPRNTGEAFDTAARAFNIAEKYQIPVIILSDFALSEKTISVEPFNLDVPIERGKIWTEPTAEFPEFKRYALSNDGISPRVIPPTKEGTHVMVGAEHDENSHSLSGNRAGLPQSGILRELMFKKRFRKLELLRNEMQVPMFWGESDANFTLICWGSMEGAVKESIVRLNEETKHTWNMLSFVDIFPLPYDQIRPLLDQINQSILIEVNFTGQFENLLHLHLDWRPNFNIHPLSGETPTHSSLIPKIMEILEGQIPQSKRKSVSYLGYQSEGATAR
jgi:2-oxoglutarate ferredoxin oxidoreductase subunit alpha